MLRPDRFFKLRSAFFGRTLASLLLRFSGLALQFGGSVLVARLLGVEGFGVYSYAFTIASILGVLAGLGMAPLASRELPRFLARGEYGVVRGYLLSEAILTLGTGALCVAILFGIEASGIASIPLGWPLVSAIVLSQAVILGFSALLNGFQRIVLSQFIENIFRQVIFIGVIGGAALAGYTVTPAGVFTVSALSTLPVLALMIYAAHRAMRSDLKPGQPMQVFLRAWIPAGIALLVMTFATQLQTNLDVLMVGAMGTDADVGRYRTASRAIDLVLIANAITVQVLGPMLSRALAQDDRAAAQRLISESAMVTAGIGLAICAVLAFAAKTYLGLFGGGFVEAAPAMRILLVGQAIGLLCGPVSVVLIMLGHEMKMMLVNLLSLAVNFGLNLVLIPRYGIDGAATATLVAVVMAKVGMLVLVRRKSELDPTLHALLVRLLHRGRG